MSVLDTKFSGGHLCPFIETNEKYIMQGQVYGKEDMKFEFMNFIPVDTVNTDHALSLLRRCGSVRDALANYDWANAGTNGDMYIVDNNDPTITYCFVDSHAEVDSTNVGKSRAIKIQTKDGFTKKIWDTQVSSNLGTPYIRNLRYNFFEVIGQSDDYVFVNIARSHYDIDYYMHRQNNHIIMRIDKNTGKFASVFDYDTHGGNRHYYGMTIKKIYDDDNCFVFSAYAGSDNGGTQNNVAAGQCVVFLYDKKNNSRVELGKLPMPTTKRGNSIYTSQGFMLNDELCFYQYSSISNPEVRLVKIDLIARKISSTNTVQTFNGKITKLPDSTITDPTQTSALCVNLFVKEYEGKKYLNILAYSTRGAVSSTYFNRITTFLIDDNTGDLIAQDYCDPFNDTAIRGFIEMVDENLLLVTNRIATKVLRFDTIKGKYVEIQVIDIPTLLIGCDSKNNIWITDTSKKIHKFSVELPVDVQLSFENDSIDYKGTDIDTNILLEAYNYMNERVSVKLELTIKGPMTFTDGSKSMTITSSKIEQIKIPTIVKGSGIISVFPKIIL